MDDLELTRHAALAAGLSVETEWDCAPEGIFLTRADGTLENWNPLNNDGDALRLAVQLNMQIAPACALAQGIDPVIDESANRQAATRRAIVRAAAALYLSNTKLIG